MERRTFLASAGIAVFTGKLRANEPLLSADPFTLGVASGDPTTTGFVLWTRLAPDPLNGGGAPNAPIQVDFEIAHDREMNSVVHSGTETAYPEHGHSIHLNLQRFVSNSHYWYRFHCQGYSTEPARVRTLPTSTDAVSSLRLGHLSCQNYSQGEFTALEDMVNYNLDLIVHLGDYIYETHFQNQVRSSLVGYDEPITLEEYRSVYGMYKSDTRLQIAHAHCPWLMTWDDHEVENGYHGNTASPFDATTTSNEEFLQRKADAYQAWWEHSPVALPAPNNGNLKVHRCFKYGNIAKFYLLDTRQYRTPNPCQHEQFFGPRCDAAYDSNTTMLGFDQELWLDQELQLSESAWQIIGSPNVIQQWKFGPSTCGFQANYPVEAATAGIDTSNCDTLQVPLYLHESWDGFPAARKRMTDSAKNAAGSVIYLSGGIHSGWVSTLKENFDDDDAEVVGVEFVGPAISSNPQLDQFSTNIIAKNEHVKWSSNRGVGWTYHVMSTDRVLTMFRTTTFPATDNSQMEWSSGWTTSQGEELPVRWL